MNKIEYKDLITFHPGYYVKDYIDEQGITQLAARNMLIFSPLTRGECILTHSILEATMQRIKNYFSKGELLLWSSSAIVIILSFCIFDRVNYMTLCASLIGVTSLMLHS